MKRYIAAILIACLCIGLTGCDLWMDGSYHSVVPHREKYSGPSQESLEVTSQGKLRSVLVDLIANGAQESVVYLIGFQESQLEKLMAAEVEYVTQRDPVGAYAVDKIEYEIGTNTGRTAVALKISYVHNRSEILRIRQVADMDGAREEVAQALEDCKTGVVLLVEEYKEVDFFQQVQDFVDENPMYCMELPQVTAAVYPNSGSRRVVELSFTYQTNREALRTMQIYVEPVFRAAYLNVSGEEDELTKFARTFTFLMERSDYTVETSITPAYSLLRHGVGDCKAFAVVYASMCRQAGLDCRVVTGTRGGEPWVWNMICVDGVYSHVDLLRSRDAGRLVRNSQNGMNGYVWDYSAYPEALPLKPVVSPQTQPTQPEPTETAPTEPIDETEETVQPTQ